MPRGTLANVIKELIWGDIKMEILAGVWKDHSVKSALCWKVDQLFNKSHL